MTDEIEEIIINTPDSSYDTSTFYGILNEAKQEYDSEQTMTSHIMFQHQVLKETIITYFGGVKKVIK